MTDSNNITDYMPPLTTMVSVCGVCATLPVASTINADTIRMASNSSVLSQYMTATNATTNEVVNVAVNTLADTFTTLSQSLSQQAPSQITPVAKAMIAYTNLLNAAKGSITLDVGASYGTPSPGGALAANMLPTNLLRSPQWMTKSTGTGASTGSIDVSRLNKLQDIIVQVFKNGDFITGTWGSNINQQEVDALIT